MIKKEILFRGKKVVDGRLIYGFYHEISSSDILYPYIICQGNSEPVVLESVEQYHHTTANGERIFIPIFYDETKTQIGRILGLKEGEELEIITESFGSVRACCSILNRGLVSQKLRLRTKQDRNSNSVTVFCESIYQVKNK